MSSTPNPTPLEPQAISSLAPDVVLTRADFDVSKPEPDGNTPAPAAQKAAAAGATVPAVDTTFRAAAASRVKAKAAPPSFGRRLKRGVISMVLTACLAGAAVLWQSSHGGAVRQLVAQWVPPFVLTLWSPPASSEVDQQAPPPVIQASAAPASMPESAPDNFASTPASPGSSQLLQLVQSMARDLAGLRQDMEQVKADIADLKASRDRMAREAARTPEPNLRTRVSLASPAPAEPMAAPARKPAPIARPVQPGAVSVSQQSARPYIPRRVEPRAAPPPSAAAPPMDLSTLRPPAALREQMP